jgi:hypothetical protein
MPEVFAKSNDAVRATEYRRRAREIYAQAAEANDELVRTALIDIARLYAMMARHIEGRASQWAADIEAAPTRPQIKLIAMDA